MSEMVERALTPIEIKQRQVDHLRLLTEIDNYQSEIDEHRRCAKDAANEVARIQSRERDLRRELRSGTVWEARQKSLEFADTLLERPTEPGISALTDEPAPEIDPPGPPPFCDHKFVDSKNCLKCGISFAELKAESLRESRRINGISDDPQSYGYGAAQEDLEPEHDKPELTDQDDPFGRRYPMAPDAFRLQADLATVLQGVLNPTIVQLHDSAPVGSTVFDRIAHWTRVELCRMNLTEHPELEPYLPGSNPMPRELAAMRKALKELETPKKKRGARPLSNPPKKRRSGSTQHTP